MGTLDELSVIADWPMTNEKVINVKISVKNDFIFLFFGGYKKIILW